MKAYRGVRQAVEGISINVFITYADRTQVACSTDDESYALEQLTQLERDIFKDLIK